MSIAYCITTKDINGAEHFTNRFLRPHCVEVSGISPFVASLSPHAYRLSEELGVDYETVIEESQYRGKLLKAMYSGLWRATQKGLPVISLRNNLGHKARSAFLDKIPMKYERVSIVIETAADPVEVLPTVNEGFDKLWVIERQPLDDVGISWAYEFLEGGFYD
jgi:hypothetical protein